MHLYLCKKFLTFMKFPKQFAKTLKICVQLKSACVQLKSVCVQLKLACVQAVHLWISKFFLFPVSMWLLTVLTYLLYSEVIFRLYIYIYFHIVVPWMAVNMHLEPVRKMCLNLFWSDTCVWGWKTLSLLACEPGLLYQQEYCGEGFYLHNFIIHETWLM